MIKEDTVFILGAGASCPYGFPDGKALRYEIINNFKSDSEIYFRRFQEVRSRIDHLSFQAEDFIEIFKKSDTKSIDLFLSRNRDFMVRGKWAIIFRILDSEIYSKFREETLYKDQNWYSYLFEQLTDEIIVKEDYCHLEDNKVSFITFNYDRSLEYYLWESYFNSFAEIDSDKKYEQIKKIKIIHLFGQVSGLEWQDENIKYKYGIDPYSVDIEKISENLRIIYEDKENPKFEEAKELIKNASRIFFLGFGYAKENLELLGIPQVLNESQIIYGTAYKFTENEIRKVRNKFTNIYGENRNIVEWDCLMLLRQYL